jgi:DNA-binding CsgD family transcriptional regulator
MSELRMAVLERAVGTSMAPHLVGRDAEVARLHRLVDGVHDTGGAVAVLGEAGVGKSALLRVAVGRARSAGFFVLETTGVESESRLPYAGVHRLLDPVLDRDGSLAPAQRRALVTALGLDEGGTPAPFLVALAVLNLLSEIAADSPVLVAVDDVQWLDVPTQDALTFVARRVSRDPIVVIGAVRKGYSAPYLEAGLAELDIGPLDNQSALELLARRAEDLCPADRERILRASSGNPLALVELPAAWRAAPGQGADDFLPLTARLQRAFAARIPDLPPATRDALLVAAIDDRDELPEILAASAKLTGNSVGVDDLDSAVVAGLLRFDELRVRFRHPLMRSAILEAESMTRRQQAHGALASVLDADPHRRTWHRAHAIVDPDDDVADELDACHRAALCRGSVLAATWALERSAQLTTEPTKRARRLLTAAEHAFDLGRPDTVDHLLDNATRSPLSELDQARMAWLREIFNDGVPGDAARVVELCDIAKRSADAGDTDLALNLLLAGALRCWWAEPGPEARARVVEVATALRDVEDDPRYSAAIAVAEPILGAAAVSERLSAVVLETVVDPNALRLLGAAAHAIGDPVRCVDFAGRAEAALREQGRFGLLTHVLILPILDLIQMGDWSGAAVRAAEGRRYAEETRQPMWATAIMSGAGLLAALRGDTEHALAVADEVQAIASRRRLNGLLAHVELTRGAAWITRGHYAEAYDALRRLFDPADPAFHVVDRFHGLMGLAEAAAHAGSVDDARSIVAGLELEAKVTPSPALHIGLSYARAVLAPDNEAEGLFSAALRQELVRWPLARARLELAYGSWLRRHRRSAESRRLLRSARTTFEQIGSEWWAEQARAALRAAGERTEARVAGLHDVLSPQEFQIAQLAAEGLSNKQIGERLYMSHRTVGSHLYRIFPKLDITSRAQLAPRLAAS